MNVLPTTTLYMCAYAYMCIIFAYNGKCDDDIIYPARFELFDEENLIPRGHSLLSDHLFFILHIVLCGNRMLMIETYPCPTLEERIPPHVEITQCNFSIFL